MVWCIKLIDYAVWAAIQYVNQVFFFSLRYFLLLRLTFQRSIGYGVRRFGSVAAKGQCIVSIHLFQDLLIVPLLAAVAFLAPTEAVDLAEQTSIGMKIGKSALSLGILTAAGLWLLNPLFRILAKSKAREVMTAAALLVVLGAAFLVELGGLSMAMGCLSQAYCFPNPVSATSLKPISNRFAAYCWDCFSSVWG